MNGFSQALLYDFQLVRCWRLDFPKDASSQEVWRLNSVAFDARPELHIHAEISNGARGGHLMWLDVEM